MAEFVAILDFGSQYTQLIARRVREFRIYCEILHHRTTAADLSRHQLVAIILSGGPGSVYEEGAPRCDPAIFEMGVPVLGICYGMQLACDHFGAHVRPAVAQREYGSTTIDTTHDPLFEGLPRATRVWMSHGDRVEGADAAGFRTIASSPSCPHAGVRHDDHPVWCLQFHPEVTHTPEGKKILENFLFRIADAHGDWSLARFAEEAIESVRAKVGDRHVVCGLSGGVDSSVVAVLLHRAIGDQLHCIFVDNGVLRAGEREQVYDTFREHYHIDLEVADAADLFLDRLRGVVDPEKKRKIIGHTFIEVFQDQAAKLERIDFLAQGTLYPDVIESVSPHGGPAVTIKSHHNVGGLPETLGFELIEPLRFLFKDEVRQIGRELGLPPSLVDRQPFPGPGLAVRIPGEVTRERLEILRRADTIVQEEMARYDRITEIWQSFAVLLPIQTVGVMGDRRTYEHVIALRVVESMDGMTADWVYLPREILATISSRISNEVAGVNRVVLDISSKPPSTIEWE